MSAATTRVVPPPRSARNQAAHARAQGAAEVVGADVAGQAQRRRNGGGVRLVQIGGRGGGEPEGIGRVAGGRAQRQPGRLDPERRRVLVVGGHGAGALAAAAPHEGCDVRPGESPVGHVARRTDDASHGGRA